MPESELSPTTCAILCSDRRDENRLGGVQLNDFQAAITKLTNMFNEVDQVPRGTAGYYSVVAVGDVGTDGGNGGGGDARNPLIFIAGGDWRGAWDFRYHANGLPGLPAGAPLRYPEAARVQLCIPMRDVDSAVAALAANGTLDYLPFIFVNVVLVPFATMKGAKLWKTLASTEKGKIRLARGLSQRGDEGFERERSTPHE